MFKHEYVVPVSRFAAGTTIGMLMFVLYALLTI